MAVKIWYSGATDVTGRALAEALHAEGTREKPAHITANDIVIGWGTKIDKDILQLGGKILNHPNAIRANRDKLRALTLMKAEHDLAGSIASFINTEGVAAELAAGRMKYPLIGRTTHHQGGAGLRLCLNKGHLDAAIKDGMKYFQSYINIVTEYRLHVFDGKVIYAVKKVENDTEAGWIAQHNEKIADYAQKNNVQINEQTKDYILKLLYKEQQLPDRIVRSNHRGWKFSSVAIDNLSAALKNAAIKAVKAVGLDFAAVDCALDESNHPWVIEANSGPGLQGTTLEKYLAAFTAKIAELQKPVVQPAAPVKNMAAGHAVGAAAADKNPVAPAIGAHQAQLMMNAVQTPEEARKLMSFLMGIL
jgi:glutathione synthase/RimK-type ligase-like ATP-grasp enzyme